MKCTTNKVGRPNVFEATSSVMFTPAGFGSKKLRSPSPIFTVSSVQQDFSVGSFLLLRFLTVYNYTSDLT